jgi:hypothetical protein
MTYEYIKHVYYHGDNQRFFDEAIEKRYKVNLDKVRKCLNCGASRPRTSWLCSGAEYTYDSAQNEGKVEYTDVKCIMEFFEKNKDLLIEAITR